MHAAAAAADRQLKKNQLKKQTVTHLIKLRLETMLLNIMPNLDKTVQLNFFIAIGNFFLF